METKLKSAMPRKPRGGEKRVRYNFTLAPSTYQRLRAAQYGLPGKSMSDIVEKAVNDLIDSLEEKRGQPFPAPPESTEDW